MADQTLHERRRFSRIPFATTAYIRCGDGNEYLGCVVLNISLKGILIIKPNQCPIRLGQTCNVDILLEPRKAVIAMHTTVAYTDGQRAGLEIQTIDLDSLTHLKRLITFNLGDDRLLHRELSALGDILIRQLP